MRIALLVVLAPSLAASPDQAVAARRGPFAFRYDPKLTGSALDWFARFDVLITHDPLPREQVDRLHAAGTRVLFYEWSVAFYDSRATKWQRSLLSGKKPYLLNETPLTGGSGSETAGAWYFDPGAETHATGRAADIALRLASSGYDGVFLDTTTVENVHPAARKEYERRHPDTPYDLAFSRFLARLRRILPDGIIFTNQGYRSAEHYLPYVDWDLTESAMTWPRDGSFARRPWNDPAKPWDSIHFLMKNLIEPISTRYPKVRFGHLNYVDEASPETTRLVVAVAQLFGGEGFVATPGAGDDVQPIYLRDPGKPVSARVDLAGGNAVYRFFERGLIAVTAAEEEITIRTGGRELRNHLTGEVICAESITLPASDGQPRAYFFDSLPQP